MVATKTKSVTSRSNAGKDYDDAAYRVYLPVCEVRSRIGDLLDLEQCFVHSPAMGNHAPDGR